MTAPRKARDEKARQWARFGEEDLRLARHALRLARSCPHRLVAYHAQQCAEKHLKAFLVARGVDFPFTHNISLLLELSEEHGAWAGKLRAAEALTRYAVTARYPGADAEVSEAEARAAVGLAAKVRLAVRKALLADGVDL